MKKYIKILFSIFFLLIFIPIVNNVEIKAEYWDGFHGSNYEIGGGNLNDYNNYTCPSCNRCGCSTVIDSRKAPTCSSSGYIAIKCSHKGSKGSCGIVCNQVGEHNFSSIGHNGMSVSAAVAPKCESTGRVDRYCSNCGAYHSSATVPASGHAWNGSTFEGSWSCSCGRSPSSGSSSVGHHYTKDCSKCSCYKDEIANTYYMNYKNSDAEISNGAVGNATETYQYGKSYNWRNGSNFYRQWEVYFNGRESGTIKNGSTTSTTVVQYSYAFVTHWNYNGLKAINSSGLKDLTPTHNATLRCTAVYGTQSALKFPAETSQTATYKNSSNSNYTAIVPTVTKVGYTLVGWTDDISAPTIEYPHDNNETNSSWATSGKSNIKWRPGDTITPPNKGKTYYAIWMPNEYTIVYNKNEKKFDTNHTTTISGKTYDEFYSSNTDTTSVTGTMANTSAIFDDTYTLSTNTYKKTSKGFYGNTINYTFVGWSLAPNFSSFNSNSRITSNENNETTPIHYYGYLYKTNLLNLSSFNYTNTSGTYNNQMLYFYNNETIKNFRNNGAKTQFNLVSSKGGVVNLYAEWIAENQRPYTYFRLATRQYYEDGRANGFIEDIMYDSYPNSIYTTSNSTKVYDDMPIYLDTVYYDPEGRVDDGDYEIEYQYSIDGGNTWYQLISGISTPNFYTTTSTISKANLDTSKNLNNTFVIDNAKSKQLIYNDKSNSTSDTTLEVLEIHFYASKNNANTKTDSSLTTLIRSRARDTVDYPIYITKATRTEINGSQTELSSSTKATLQKPLWSTGNYAFSYSSTNIKGTLIDEYTGEINSWSNQKAFVQSTTCGKNTYNTSVDNGGDWYTKNITCYVGNSSDDDDRLVAMLDNKYTYPMYDYTNDNGNYNNQNGNLYMLISKLEENATSKNETTLISEILLNRGYVTYDNYGNLVVDYRPLYTAKTNLIRQTKVKQSDGTNINNRYSSYPNADESIGFINLSADLDNIKHYNNGKNPTYSIDNIYNKKYYHTNDTQNNTKHNKQFSNYFIAIYDKNGNEVLTQAGASTTNVTYTKNANGVFVATNGSKYTFPKTETGLSKDITGHIYNSYEQMISDIYKYTNSMFSEYSDMLNGEYTIYFAVCDKSWNVYSPNKWSMQISTLITSPRLSFYDVGITDFRQTGYKNEDKVQTLWLKTGTDNKIISYTVSGTKYTFPMYKLSGLTSSQTVNGNKIYINNFALTQAQQRYQLNTDYVKDTTLGYKENPLYKVQAGYNFTINVDIQGADYTELTIYNANNPSTPVQVIQKDFDTVMNKNNSNVLYSYACRQNGFNSYTISFPEQVVVGDKYYMEIKAYKTTLTNTTHALSTTNNGTKTLYRTFTLGSQTSPIIEIEESMLQDVGVDLVN